MVRVKKPDLVYADEVHNRVFNREHGISSLPTIGQRHRDLSADKLKGNKRRLVEGSWVDGTAAQSLAEALELDGQIDNGAEFGIPPGRLELAYLVVTEQARANYIQTDSLDVTTGATIQDSLLVLGDALIGSEDTHGLDLFGHLRFKTSAAPTITLGAAAGTGASQTREGSDCSFRVVLTTGTGTTTGTLFTVTFAASWPSPAAENFQVVWSPSDADASAASAWVYYDQANKGPSTFPFVARVALVPSTSYRWDFHVFGGGF